MGTRRYVFLLSIFLYLIQTFYTINLIGQTTVQKSDNEIKGRILNKSSLPVDFATIALVGIDSIPINGEISNELGEFIIKNIVSGTYRLIVQHLEYETYYSELFQMTSNNYFVYPDIVLIGSSINLDEVVITGRKAMIEI